MMRFTVDRLEGDKAVLLLREDETQQLVVSKAELPFEAHEGAVLRVTLALDAGEEDEARRRTERLIDKLKCKNQRLQE